MATGSAGWALTGILRVHKLVFEQEVSLLGVHGIGEGREPRSPIGECLEPVSFDMAQEGQTDGGVQIAQIVARVLAPRPSGEGPWLRLPGNRPRQIPTATPRTNGIPGVRLLHPAGFGDENSWYAAQARGP